MNLYHIRRRLTDLLPDRLLYRLSRQSALWRLRYAPSLLDFYVRRKTPVLVYQVGRVGSNSIYRSLLAHGVLALHCHTLNPANRSAYVSMYSQQEAWIYRSIVKAGVPLKAIILVRDPIANVVSWNFYQARNRVVKGGMMPTLDSLQAGLGRYLDDRLPLIVHWFEREIQPVLDVDVLVHPFDREAGYTHIVAPALDLLVMKTSLDDDIKRTLVADFTGQSDFVLENYNQGERDALGALYRQHKETVRIPAHYLDYAYDSPFSQHFFTTAEIAHFRQTWAVNAT